MSTSSRTKIAFRVALLLAVVSGLARQSHAGTDIEAFDRQTARSTAENQVERPKAICVCLSGQLAGVAGILTHSAVRIVKSGDLGDIDVQAVNVDCVALGFDIDTGASARSRGCFPFAILPR